MFVGGGCVGGGVGGGWVGGGAGFAVVGVPPPPRRGAVVVERRAVVVVRPTVVPGPVVVEGTLPVVAPGSVVVVDEELTAASSRIGRGLPTEVGIPAMATPTPAQMARRRTMPARLAAAPCKSMPAA